MHKDIRRKDRATSEIEARELLEKCEHGTLATAGLDGQPYALPISYIVMNGSIYIHCAKLGKKLDNFAANPKVSFCVIGPTEPVYDGGFSTFYESCVVFGSVREVTDDTEKKDALIALCQKYLPNHMDKAEKAAAKSWGCTLVFAISMDRVTGKAKRHPPA